MKQQRQGDVLFTPVAKLPKGACKQKPERIVAYGEVTGHMHAVTDADIEGSELYEIDGEQYLVVTGDNVRIIHGKDRNNLAPVSPGEDRHNPLTLDPGVYRVTIQIEETPDAIIRQVTD